MPFPAVDGPWFGLRGVGPDVGELGEVRLGGLAQKRAKCGFGDVFEVAEVEPPFLPAGAGGSSAESIPLAVNG